MLALLFIRKGPSRALGVAAEKQDGGHEEHEESDCEGGDFEVGPVFGVEEDHGGRWGGGAWSAEGW